MAGKNETDRIALDGTDWGALVEAYGAPGTEVCRLLGRLPGEPEVLAAIEDRIAHQGTVVPEVAIAAIPLLAAQLALHGPFEWPSRHGVAVTSDLPRFVALVLAGEGRLKVGPRQWTTLAELLERAA
jgi:hypothetical protein